MTREQNAVDIRREERRGTRSFLLKNCRDALVLRALARTIGLPRVSIQSSHHRAGSEQEVENSEDDGLHCTGVRTLQYHESLSTRRHTRTTEVRSGSRPHEKRGGCKNNVPARCTLHLEPMHRGVLHTEPTGREELRGSCWGWERPRAKSSFPAIPLSASSLSGSLPSASFRETVGVFSNLVTISLPRFPAAISLGSPMPFSTRDRCCFRAG